MNLAKLCVRKNWQNNSITITNVSFLCTAFVPKIIWWYVAERKHVLLVEQDIHNFKYEIILLNERGDMRTTAQQIPTMQKYNDMIPVHELQQ